MEIRKQNVDVFNQDASQGGGYVYTDQGRISSRIANARISRAIEAAADFKGKTVLDLGCGDGTYTMELAALGVARIVGVDPADTAIEKARQRASGRPEVEFVAANLYDLPEGLKSGFDIVVLRGVLHHLPDAERAVAIALQVGQSVVILEPNGANPVLKLLESFSAYHIKHEEQSFLAGTIDGWCVKGGGRVAYRRFLNLVPMFCPDWMARILDRLTPLAEKLPLIRMISCGQYIVRADRQG